MNTYDMHQEDFLIDAVRSVWPGMLRGNNSIRKHSIDLHTLLVSGVEPAFVRHNKLYFRVKSEFLKGRLSEKRMSNLLRRKLNEFAGINIEIGFFVVNSLPVNDLWNQIIAEIRDHDPMLYSVLLGTSLNSVVDYVVSINTATPFHQQYIARNVSNVTVEYFLSRKLGFPVELRFGIGSLEQYQDLREIIRAARKSDMVRAAMNIFEAHIVDIEPWPNGEVPAFLTSAKAVSPNENSSVHNGAVNDAPVSVIPVSIDDLVNEDESTLDVLGDFLQAKGEVGIGLMATALMDYVARKRETVNDVPLNNASLANTQTFPYDGILFRSPAEIAIYKALKKRNVLFFPNTTAVLGSKNLKREPDFLICQNGKWGILEVQGDTYHPPVTAAKDHQRARLFKDYGLMCIEFYAAKNCIQNPDAVVDDFLRILGQS